MKLGGRWIVVLPMSVLVVATACSGSNASTKPSGSPAGGEKVAVSLQQWAVAPDTSTIPAGPVTFSVKNIGSIPHEFVVLETETPAADIKIESFEGEANRIDEDTAGTNVGETGDMDAGSAKTLTIDLAPGHYVFLCNLPTHYGLGMHTDFTVT